MRKIIQLRDLADENIVQENATAFANMVRSSEYRSKSPRARVQIATAAEYFKAGVEKGIKSSGGSIGIKFDVDMMERAADTSGALLFLIRRNELWHTKIEAVHAEGGEPLFFGLAEETMYRALFSLLNVVMQSISSDVRAI